MTWESSEVLVFKMQELYESCFYDALMKEGQGAWDTTEHLLKFSTCIDI